MTTDAVSAQTARDAQRERNLRIEVGPYLATISEVGGALVSLTHDDRPLVYSRDAATPDPRFRGAMLAPWPNRIRDGRYTFDGRSHQLPINEPARFTALHGLALYQSWTLAGVGRDSAAFQTMIWPQPGYPFTVALHVAYELGGDTGLRIELTARNVGTDAAPYGASIHPYLSAGHGVVDDWTFHADAGSALMVDEERLLPVGTATVAGTPYDFRSPVGLAGRVIDNALTEIGFDRDGWANATLLDQHGRGVRMTWQHTCAWLQVHTTDLPGQPAHRRGLAVEPMTCPPDAFNSGQGLIRLEAGDRHVTSWRIHAV